MNNISDLVKTLAVSSTRTESPIEGRLLSAMARSGKFILVSNGEKAQGAGLFIYPQYQIGKYRADFMIDAVMYSRTNKVWPPHLGGKFILECDGAMFHTSQEQIQYDKERDEYMQSLGYVIIRLTGSEIHRDSNACANYVLNIIYDNIKEL